MLNPSLILASSSAIRADILRNAGVSFEVIPSDVDERAVQNTFSGTDHCVLARELAYAKAQSVSNLHKTSVVLGVDQVLVFNGKRFDKPKSLEEASLHLQELNVLTHVLSSAVVAFDYARCLWEHQAHVEVTFRKMSSDFMQRYIHENKEKILFSLGCCLIEGTGAQLIERVKGDYFAVLGLPLFPVLGFLRDREVLAI
jgi:septum formation protein